MSEVGFNAVGALGTTNLGKTDLKNVYNSVRYGKVKVGDSVTRRWGDLDLKVKKKRQCIKLHNAFCYNEVIWRLLNGFIPTTKQRIYRKNGS